MRSKTMILVVGVLLAFNSFARAVTIDFVTVGDPDNANDDTGYGSVDYTYKIGKYEVTNSQYSEFLNAVAALDTHNLYHPHMSQTYGGINQIGSPGNYSYSLKPGWENKPASYIGWYDCLRFANWLHNGQPGGLQDGTTTEDGAYDMTGSQTRKSDALFWLPNDDEWYKAAYYKAGGTNTGYWDYPTQSDIAPTSEAPPGGVNSANYYDAGSYAVDGSHIAEVGAYVFCNGPYGTFDQAGNMWEWTEGHIDEYRIMRGGSWNNPASHFIASHYGYSSPDDEDGYDSFRIATVPEPATFLLLGFGASIVRRKR